MTVPSAAWPITVTAGSGCSPANASTTTVREPPRSDERQLARTARSATSLAIRTGTIVPPGVLAFTRADSRRAQAQLPRPPGRDDGAVPRPDRYPDGARARVGVVELAGADGRPPAAVPRPRHRRDAVAVARRRRLRAAVPREPARARPAATERQAAARPVPPAAREHRGVGGHRAARRPAAARRDGRRAAVPHPRRYLQPLARPQQERRRRATAARSRYPRRDRLRGSLPR